MISCRSRKRARLFIFSAACLALVASGLLITQQKSAAQATRPLLISESGSTRAVALESVTRLREPFARTQPHNFASDGRTRLQFLVLNVEPFASADNVRVEAEDANNRIYNLPVEHIGGVPGQPLLSSVTVRLADDLGDVGDVLVRLTYRGVQSNRVRVGIGHIGGGLPDDVGSVPTPAPAANAPTPNTNPLLAGNLTPDDVRAVIAQAVSAAAALNRAVTVAVTDREGNVLGVFRMTGATLRTRFNGGTVFQQTADPVTGLPPLGLEGADFPAALNPARLAAITKAGTASFFSTSGNAFTPRTASFIIQEHFPPNVTNQPSGPLFGVQFSQLFCSDIKKPGLPLGLSGDPGGVPLYKNGLPAGGVGIEGDGLYTVDRDPTDFDKPLEELIAVAAARGYEAPAQIRGDNIIVGGIRLPFTNVTDADAPRPSTIPFASLPGTVDPDFPIRGAQPSAFVPMTLDGSPGAVDTRFFPFIGSTSGSANALTANDVRTVIAQAAHQADITRAAIRQPLGSAARVSITVVDTEGQVLGIFRTFDAPVFGFDVSAQKARTALFFSRNNAGAQLRAAGFSRYVDAAAQDGIQLNGSIAFSDRAGGFLSRPFFPDGIDGTQNGPFSYPINQWSVFNDGLQLDLVRTNLIAALLTPAGMTPPPCTAISYIPNGIQIFPGSVPLYKNGELVGAVGISGDGVDQDDIIASAGSAGFVPPAAIRADQVFVRGVRLPFVKFPRSPNL
ncbi:MAG TPA: heme-binding protein [Pyrinomonadaceae bacterium]